MKYQSLQDWRQQTLSKFPKVSTENFNRVTLLSSGISYQNKSSYPDPFSHIELIFTSQRLSSTPFITFLTPDSPFKLLDGNGQDKLLFYNDDYLDTISDYEERNFDFRKPDPFYFYVQEINGDLVLKLNPIQLCDFFQNTKGMLPCSFCFRNDMVQRFKNISAKDLVKLIITEEKRRDNLLTLQTIDEISIVTGSYTHDDKYLSEISILISELLPYTLNNPRVVVGSHEGKGLEGFLALKEAGITVFAFPVESLDDHIRTTQMRNRKGDYPIEAMIKDIESAITVFGEDGVIVRLVAGMGDILDHSFEEKIEHISKLGNKHGPWWNINQYMPFTHYHWKLFQSAPPYTFNYLWEYLSILNTYVPETRQMRFKVSP